MFNYFAIIYYNDYFVNFLNKSARFCTPFCNETNRQTEKKK